SLRKNFLQMQFFRRTLRPLKEADREKYPDWVLGYDYVAFSGDKKAINVSCFEHGRCPNILHTECQDKLKLLTSEHEPCSEAEFRMFYEYILNQLAEEIGEFFPDTADRGAAEIAASVARAADAHN